MLDKPNVTPNHTGAQDVVVVVVVFTLNSVLKGDSTFIDMFDCFVPTFRFFVRFCRGTLSAQGSRSDISSLVYQSD